MRDFLVVVAAGVGTYLLRASLVLVLGRFEVPAAVEHHVRYVAPAALAAIAAPALIAPEGVVALPSVRVAAGIIAIGFGWWTRKLLPTVIAGLVAFYLFGAVV